MSFESPITKLLSHIITLKVSDVFVSEGKIPYVRLNGEVCPLSQHPIITQNEMVDFLTHILQPKVYELFQKSGDLDLGYSLDHQHRLRLNIARQKGLLSIVARPLTSGAFEFEELGIPKIVQDWIQNKAGLILVVGATGSGKSTSLAAMIHAINQQRRAHIVTIEDPIEFVHQDISSCVIQREVGTDTVSFHEGLKRVLRQSPDVIMIGEMRDKESIEVALSAAMTGHLVLSTLHTVDAMQTLQRIMSYFPRENQKHLATDLSFSLKGILAQRLVPNQNGQGRSLVFECLSNTASVAQLIREQNELSLEELMRDYPTPEISTFNQSLYQLVQDKKINQATALAYSYHREELQLLFQGMGKRLPTDTKNTIHDSDVTTIPDLHQVTTLPDLHQLLRMTLQHDSSDLHLTVDRPPIVRKLGTLIPLIKHKLTAQDMRVLLDSVMTHRQRSNYELNKEIDFSLSLEQGSRFRVNAYFQRGRMAASLRAIPSRLPNPQDIFIPHTVLQLCDKPHGLILVVGPTGSGKSTTLACMINQINQNKRCRIITIEDPIEFVHTPIQSTIDQREVYEDTKSITAALKYVLRQDPDVILIGEMRDQETIAAALTAAETGHLVFATLHTNDAVQTIDRIIDIFPARQQSQIRSQLASSLVAVLSQRLLPHRQERKRVPIFEVMVGTNAIKTLIREGKMHQALGVMEVSSADHMITMDKALLEAFQRGLIAEHDVRLYIRNAKALNAYLPSPVVMSSRIDS